MKRSGMGARVRWIGMVGLLCLVVAGSMGLSSAGEKRELVLLNWPNYMDPSLARRFEEQTGIHLRTVEFETDETRDELLARTQGKGFDLFVVSGERVQGYVKKNWLAPLGPAEVGHLQHVPSRWLDSYPGVRGFAAPVLWGTFGIAYRQDLVPDPPTTWKGLMQPEERFRKRIILEKESVDLMGMAMKAMGHSWNHYEESAIEEARRMLMAQKPFVRAYGYPSFDSKSALVTGEAWLASVFNGDALTLKDLDDRIGFIVPEEGSVLWVDCLVVAAGSTRKSDAYALIQFLHEPAHAAQLAQHLHFATVNQEAEPLLRPEHRNNPVIYPPETVLTRSEFVAKPPPRIDRRYKEILRALLN
ncbi:MAG: spermidine/putrescine ABC transporter substrate-binding protein [Magnetococcales bacterium]|nr:spermidine/putrescine ABC transporter substrate-binding protein [Magnetococcales bacterium]